MFAHELYEQNKPRVVVTYPGRFQPFHQGHAGVFAQLQKKFGAENVFVLTSNDTSSAKSPFNFSDKYQLITAAGVPGNHIIETNKMYALPEAFDPVNTIFVTAVGAPDADRLNPDTVTKRDQKDKDGNIVKPAGSPSYYKVWNGVKDAVTADKHGYVVVIPEIKKSIKIKGKNYDVSHGTECRMLWNHIRKNAKARQEFLGQMYARPSAEIAAIYDKIPETAKEDILPDNVSTTSPIHGNINEMGGVGVIASKRQAKDPRYSMSLTRDVRPGAVQKSLRAFRLAEDDSNNQIALAALDFYKHQVRSVEPEKVENYNDKAKQLLAKADPSIKAQVLDALKKGKENPYLQGGIITTVASLIAGGVIASAQHMQLNPTQTNILLQAIMNTIVPTLISKINGKSWLDTIKYTLASAGIGTGIAAVVEQVPPVAGRIPMFTPPGIKSPQQQAAAQLGYGEEEELQEKWTKKYKKSINCSNPKGFSQKAHCAGRRARQAGKKTKSHSISENLGDFEIHNYEKLDNVLVKLCEMVVQGQQSGKDYGMVAACVIDPDDNIVFGINIPGQDGKRIHAEHDAMDRYTSKYGAIPDGSIIVTTLSPCSEPMAERDGASCTDFINQTDCHKVYAGYRDPSQEYSFKTWHLEITRNNKIQALCKKFADTFLDKITEDQDTSITAEEMEDMIEKFLPLAAKELAIEKLPHVILQKELTPHDGQATFGRFVDKEERIYLGIANRHPVDILRTLAHELVHFKQFLNGEMYHGAGDTGSPIENEANAVAGVIMRHFNKKYPDAIKSKPLELQ